MIHLSLHFLIPLAVAVHFYREQWLKPFLIMLLATLIDLDHLIADPIYDPNRCSIGFHPMHTLIPSLLYLLLLIPKNSRLLGIGLCIHIALDSIDCQVTNGIWYYQEVAEKLAFLW